YLYLVGPHAPSRRDSIRTSNAHTTLNYDYHHYYYAIVDLPTVALGRRLATLLPPTKACHIPAAHVHILTHLDPLSATSLGLRPTQHHHLCAGASIWPRR